jgi:hypothetical protein
MRQLDRLRRYWAGWNQLTRLAVLAWGLVLIGVCVYAAGWPHNHNVYLIFAEAGRHWRGGEPLYGAVQPGLDVFRYSPLAASLFAPLSLLPVSAAGVLWRLLNAAIYIAGLAWWLREVVPGRLTRTGWATLFLLLLPLSLPNLINGQVNPLMIGLVVAAAAAARAGRFTPAGFAAALACWLKLYPVAVGLLLVMLYRRKFFAPFLVGLAAGFAVPFVLQAPAYVAGQYGEWLTYLQEDHRELGPIQLWFKDARLLLRLSGVALPSWGYPTLEVLSGLGIAVLCWWRQQRGDGARGVLLLTTYLGCGWMTLFGPATETAAWIILAPALVTALVLSCDQPRRRVQLGLLLACYVLLVLAHPVKRSLWDRWEGFLGIQPLAGLIFCAWVVSAAVRGDFAGMGEPAPMPGGTGRLGCDPLGQPPPSGDGPPPKLPAACGRVLLVASARTSFHQNRRTVK